MGDVPHVSGMPRVTIPDDLCPEHQRIGRAWRNNRYDPRNPREWGGGHILDSRTSHTERAAGWARKNAEQITATIATCRSGRSPQCTLKES